MNLNEECLLQYLMNPTHSQSFVIESGINSEIFDCADYNEVACFFA